MPIDRPTTGYRIPTGGTAQPRVPYITPTPIPSEPRPYQRPYGFAIDQPLFDPTQLQGFLEQLGQFGTQQLQTGAGLGQTFQSLLNRPTNYGAVRGELDAVAQGTIGELFREGGQVDQAIRQASGASVQSGFGPSSGGRDNAIFNILAGARGQTSDAIARAAPQLASVAQQDASSRLNAGLQGYLGTTAQGLGAIESAFGGASAIQQGQLADYFGRAQLGLAQDQFGLARDLGYRQADLAEKLGLGQLSIAQKQLLQNQQLIDQALKNQGGGGIFGKILGGIGKIAGGVLGSAAGPFGAAIGGVLGDKVGNLFNSGSNNNAGYYGGV